jgi:hypothetical protein
MPGDDLTHGPPATKKQAAVTTGWAGSSGIPCATVLTVSFALSPGTGCLAPVIVSDLASAPGRQDHTTSPYAQAALVSRGKPIHRIPAPRVVTIAMRPSWRGGMGKRIVLICPTRQADYFQR